MKFRRKRILTLDELNAYRKAYGKPIQKKELFLTIMIPFSVTFFYTFILYYYWWLSFICGVIGAIYGYIFITSQQVKRVYENNAFRERNNFINTMTQLLTNNERTVLQALQTVTERANGEFKKDLQKLSSELIDANNEDIKNAFQELADKYEKDVIFSMYVEQLITAATQGRTNVDTLKDIKSYHNEVKKRQEKFFEAKKRKERDFKYMCRVGLFFIAAVTFSFGFGQFIENYAHHAIGWVSSAIYLLILARIFHTFLKRMGDDSVMEVKI